MDCNPSQPPTQPGRRLEAQPTGYLEEVWCIAIELLGVTEASGTIGQVSYGLLRKEVLDDAGVILKLVRCVGMGDTHKYGYMVDMSCMHR